MKRSIRIKPLINKSLDCNNRNAFMSKTIDSGVTDSRAIKTSNKKKPMLVDQAVGSDDSTGLIVSQNLIKPKTLIKKRVSVDYAKITSMNSYIMQVINKNIMPTKKSIFEKITRKRSRFSYRLHSAYEPLFVKNHSIKLPMKNLFQRRKNRSLADSWVSNIGTHDNLFVKHIGKKTTSLRRTYDDAYSNISTGRQENSTVVKKVKLKTGFVLNFP